VLFGASWSRLGSWCWVGDIVDPLGVSSKSITQWEENYETFGGVAPPSGLRDRPVSWLCWSVSDDRQITFKFVPHGQDLAEACFTAVTVKKARGWYCDSKYIQRTCSTSSKNFNSSALLCPTTLSTQARTTSWRTLLPGRWNPDSKAGWEPGKRVGCMCCHPWVRQGHYKQVLTSIQWASLVSWQWCNNLFIICGLIYQTETTVDNIVLCKSLRHFEGVLYLPYAASSSGPINFEPVSFSTSEVRDKPSCASEAFPDTIDIVNSQREVCGYIINVL
jgi:hypothetical protein